MPASSDQMGFDFGQGSRPAASDDISTRCAHCRDKMVVPAWYIGQTQLHFCDATCRQAWTEAEPSFEVEFGNASKRRGANWEIQAREARERDSFACQVCGVSEEALGRQLDVHHKIPYRYCYNSNRTIIRSNWRIWFRCVHLATPNWKPSCVENFPFLKKSEYLAL